ncbi:hypothetical protein [Paraburkholderia hospita]|uniref:hypothetical protein n=1 Tax=Paraburkholderia hospita TaxID=169430 RepID=UPI0008A7349D|nr:hypothetical protein [Paraburkholderia hospita]SEI14622.1 hypothetical protein SAMN05192544_102577 [Paraburkholderia hospita]
MTRSAASRPNDLQIEEQIRQEVARIRTEFPYRGDYRGQLRALIEALFFRFGERAGAQRLVNLLAIDGKSPSTSTAQDEINKFWEQVREASQIRIQRADLPPFLLEIFGRAAADIWENSLQAANATFEDFRLDAESQVRDALASASQESDRADAAQRRAAEADSRAQAADVLREEMAIRLSAAEAAREAAEKTLDQIRRESAELERQRSETITGLQETVEQLRAASNRLQDEQRRLLVVADDYKTAAARDRDSVREERENVRALNQTILNLQGSLNRASTERGIFEGRAVAAESLADRLHDERERARTDTEAALMRAANAEARAVQLERELAQKMSQPTTNP